MQSTIVYSDKECQIAFLQNDVMSALPEKTFVCFRYSVTNDECDVEIQTGIFHSCEKIIIPNRKTFKNKSCVTTERKFVDCSIWCKLDSDMCDKHFAFRFCWSIFQ